MILRIVFSALWLKVRHSLVIRATLKDFQKKDPFLIDGKLIAGKNYTMG